MEELLKLLTYDDYQNLDIILDALDTGKSQNVRSDSEILGYIHHAIYLDQYAKPEFRKKLFEKLPSTIQKEYFKKCGISPNTSDDDSLKQTILFEWGPNTQTENFVNYFGYPKYLLPLNEEDKKPEPYKMLFDFQADAVFDTLEKIKTPLARALIQMPTGTGKTRTAMDIIVRLLNQKDKQFQIVWFANSAELLEQAHEAFVHVWSHTGNKPDLEILKLWGTDDAPLTIPKGNCIIFAGYQKFRGLKNTLNPDYVFVDEAHQILARMYEQSLDSLIDHHKQTRVVGLTATPGRGLSDIQNERLVAKFQKHLVPIKFHFKEKEEMYEDIIEYLEDEGILAKNMDEPLYTDFEYDLSEKEWKDLTKIVKGDHPEYREELLKKLANDNVRNTLIIDKLKKYADDGKKILYFSASLEQSIVVFVALQKLGVNAVHVDGYTDKTFRKQIIERFKKTDEISVICNFNIFSTGFDVPDLDVVFIGRPVNSPVLIYQMVGRGTRGVRMGATESTFILAYVIDKIKSRFDGGFVPYKQYGFWSSYWKND